MPSARPTVSAVQKNAGIKGQSTPSTPRASESRNVGADPSADRRFHSGIEKEDGREKPNRRTLHQLAPGR